ncbi:MAG: hypothetical protein RLY64_159, partial [Bacteroidota bacterium]
MRHFSVVFAFFLSFLFYSNGFSQNITVLAPNGGETLAGCSNYNIRWTATGTSNYFYIDYSVNNGTSWASLATNIQYNGGIFTWTVPNISSSQALIRVRDAVDTNIIDQSNAVFTITPALVLNSPNGGEVWQGGTYQNISWAVSAGSSTYQVEYSMNAGVTWTSIATTSNNSYYWLVPNTPTTTAMVRVRDINSTCRGDVSDNLFTITAATPSIVVNNPWQGAVWSISTSQTISWSNAYLPSSTVHVSLSLDSGLTWSRLYSNTATGTTSGSVSNWPVS